MPRLSFDAEVEFGRFDLSAAFDVEEGEIVVLVGPNGSGKSTCLHLAAGLLRPRRARITLGSRILCDTKEKIDLPPERRRVGLVFQDYALFPHRSVAANVRYGAPTANAAARWIETLGLVDLARERVDRLSGGQRQRVALARALAAEPEALLLDEPLAALDVGTRAAVRAELRAFLREVALPTVFVTHDPVDALVLGERFVVLESGSVIQAGGRDELLRRPRSVFVAELAGLNCLRARLEGESAIDLRTAHAGPLEFHVLSDAPPGEVFVAFGPSAVSVSTIRPEGSAQNTFETSVREIVRLVDRTRLALEVRGAAQPLLADITREAEHALAIEPGRHVWAAVKSTSIQVYR